MDIATQSEIILREGGYDTWPLTASSSAVTCFENASVVGFLHVFPSVQELVGRWESAQNAVLSRYAPALRTAGAKAWNVYSVFFTSEQQAVQDRAIERIEENFALTRKIARTGIRTADDLARGLSPLLPVKALPVTAEANFETRLNARLKDVPSGALTAFFGGADAETVARLLGAGS